MNLSDMRDFVRIHADTDVTDAPDSTLELYARLAYNDIRRRVGQWVDNNGSATLTSVADTGSYALSGLTGDTIELVQQVVGPREVLRYVSWTEYIQLLEGGAIDYSSAEATMYTVRGNSIYLWPTPSAVRSYTVYGVKAFTAWPSGSDEPDLPREFDEPICWFMLSKYYMAQEDLELAQMYSAQYEQMVNRFIAAAMREDSHSPRILGGALRRRLGYGDWIRRNTEG